MEYVSNQQVFDVVANHLISQGRKSELHGGCAYRGEDGTKCAIGCLIPDKLYDPEIEGKRVGELFREHEWPKNLLGDIDMSLLIRLQHVHDTRDPDEWGKELVLVANYYGLKLPSGLLEE